MDEHFARSVLLVVFGSMRFEDLLDIIEVFVSARLLWPRSDQKALLFVFLVAE